ncbi:hypothetical protein PINS_up020135 [Pythium insidiosum]|nr:hypothetical protein PINS_up020135 [Pythium insidiosum]
MKHTPKIDTEPLQRLQSMILSQARTGKMELTSIVAREGSGQRQGTLTVAQIPTLWQIPGMIFTMTNLTELVLRCNQISQVPKEIGALCALDTLDLSENQLTELPRDICQLLKLRVLELGENSLTCIPTISDRSSTWRSFASIGTNCESFQTICEAASD